MVLGEIVRTGSHDRVAWAAAVSIGRDFLERTRLAARQQGVPQGAFVAQAIRRFAAEADAADWDGLRQKIAGSPMPVLAGVRHIVDVMIDRSPTRH